MRSSRALAGAAALVLAALPLTAAIADDSAQARRTVLDGLLARERERDPAAGKPAPSDAAADLAYLARRAGRIVTADQAQPALRRLDGMATSPPLALALAELELVRALGGWVSVTTLPGPPPLAAPLPLVSPEVDVAPSFPARKVLPELGSLRRRLVQSGDLSARYLVGGSSVDRHVADAVRRFQARHGLLADGVVGRRTLRALNAPVRAAIAKARLNLARFELTDPLDARAGLPRFVEVNVPGYELRLVEGGRVVLRSRVVVGEEDSATPIFDELLRTIEINPSWYVPRSIEAELLETERSRPGYLAANGFYWRAAAAGRPDHLVQRPGPENGLGKVKFLFPNHHAVYLHDTPKRGGFSRTSRSLSHGCVRVEKPFELALALLRPQGWDASRLGAAFAGVRTRRIELATAVPVFLDYRTAFVDEAGLLQLRADLYGHDARGVTRFAEKGLSPAETEPGLVQVRPLAPPRAAERLEPVADAGPPASQAHGSRL